MKISVYLIHTRLLAQGTVIGTGGAVWYRGISPIHFAGVLCLGMMNQMYQKWSRKKAQWHSALLHITCQLVNERGIVLYLFWYSTLVHILILIRCSFVVSQCQNTMNVVLLCSPVSVIRKYPTCQGARRVLVNSIFVATWWWSWPLYTIIIFSFQTWYQVVQCCGSHRVRGWVIIICGSETGGDMT